jgi:flagellar biosynthesis protein FlhF
MRIRKFEAATVQQAINKVKTELGDKAVILHTRTFPGRFFGLLGKPHVEVTAAIEEQQPLYSPLRGALRPPPSKPFEMAPPPSEEFKGAQNPAQAAAHEFLARMNQIRLGEKESPASPQTAADDSSGAVPQANSTSANQTPSNLDLIRFERLEVRFDQLANTMERLLSLSGPLGKMGVLTGVPDAWHSAMQHLLESNLSETVLTEIGAKLRGVPHPGQELETNMIRDVLAGFVKTKPPIERPESGQRVIALIGPTGVGKTTTLAKLASGLVVSSRTPTRVALITVDTYRLAAVEQLETYAKILNLDLHVVYGPEEMPDALSKCRDSDVVFLDTAGRSPRDDAQMADLKEFLDRVPQCEKYLVLSSTMNDKYLREAVDRFRAVDIDSLIVTKLDETRNYALPINLVRMTGLPVSYLTTGQNVPEDIESVQASRLAESVLSNVTVEIPPFVEAALEREVVPV